MEDSRKAPPQLDEERQKQARRYAEIRRRLLVADTLIGGVLLWLFIFSGFKEIAAGLPGGPMLQAALYFLLLVIAYGIPTIPLRYYGHVLAQRYGLSTQSVGGWLKDFLKAAFLMLLLGAAAFAVIYWFIESWPDIWWLLTWGLLIIVSFVFTALAPIIILPLFMTVKPLYDESLKERLLKLAERAGVKISGVYEADFSSRGTTSNAGLIGIGGTKRVVLSDTLLKEYTLEEIKVIMAHELGHERAGDIFRLFGVQAAAMLGTFYLTAKIYDAAIGAFDFGSIADPAALPLLALIAGILNIALTPFLLAYTRRRELAADGYALKLTNDKESFVNMMTKIHDQNLDEADPPSWVERFFYDHPSYKTRIALAGSLPAEEKGKRLA